MSAILDILIVVIIGVTIGFAVKNGFVKTVLSAASFLIALAVNVCVAVVVAVLKAVL